MIQETGTALAELLMNIWNSFIIVIPGLVAAIIVLIVGYIIGAILSLIVRKGLRKSKIFDKLLDKTGFTKVAGKFDFPAFFGILVKWYIIILFLNPAADLVKLSGLSVFLNNLALWIPNLIIAVIIGLLGFMAAEYIRLKINETKASSADVIGLGAKVIVLIFTAIIALKQVGIDITIAESSLLIILAGIMLAVGIGFGLALKDTAKVLIKDIKKKI